MDTTYPSPESKPSLILNDQILAYLDETRKWGKFLAILGFIGIGLIVVLGLCIGSIMNLVSSMSPTPIPFPTFFLTFVYLLIALLYFFPVLYLYRFATKMESALAMRDEAYLASSFENLKSLFKFMGIMMIVVFSLYILIFIGVIFGVMFVHHSSSVTGL